MTARLRLYSLVWLALVCWLQQAQAQNNQISGSLPGQVFNSTFNQYSGYLTTPSNTNFFYWLVEATENADTAPLLLWPGGGPGCSGIWHAFGDSGPYRISPDGQIVTENVFSWNKLANILYIDSPYNVGFSYRNTQNNTSSYSDNATVYDTADFLKLFVAQYPAYANRAFYISGISYNGVVGPLLAQLLLSGNNNVSLNLKGLIIGNGYVSALDFVDANIVLAYNRGVLDPNTMTSLIKCCPQQSNKPYSCQWAQAYLQLDNSANRLVPKPGVDEMCAPLVAQWGQNNWLEHQNTYDIWDVYQGCYVHPSQYNSSLLLTPSANVTTSSLKSRFIQLITTRDPSASVVAPVVAYHFDDQGRLINTKSSDEWDGYSCYLDHGLSIYLNRADVQQAIHAANITWQNCTPLPGYTYVYDDTTPIFQTILSNNNLSILLYNGDSDAVCNFIGARQFVNRLPVTPTSHQHFWHYGYFNTHLAPIAGNVQHFKSNTTTTTLTLLTVKGAGHQAGLNRPGPTLQAVSHFLASNSNYSLPANVTTASAPVVGADPLYAYSRKEAARVHHLPGLTFEPKFESYSGYLKGVPGNYLHYWLVTSQTNPVSDPLFLWLTGGPGCSSLGALLSELGPFRPNPDNLTISENPFAWNKFANIIFLESPRGVGFSFQDWSVNNDTGWDDAKSTEDAYLALADFFTAFPEYVNRQFYVVGESYGGIYVPRLTSLLTDKILAGDMPYLNLVGMAVGNGELSQIQNFNSLYSDLYFHGYLGKGDWDSLAGCCNTSYQNLPFCNFYDIANQNSTCANYVNNLQYLLWENLMDNTDVYNELQDCYQQTAPLLGSAATLAHRITSIGLKRNVREAATAATAAGYSQVYLNDNDNFNPITTDPLGGFPCFGTQAAAEYLNLPEVREALHIPHFLPNQWAFCNDTINENYNSQTIDTGIYFRNIIQSNRKMKILIYNGDVDFACNFLGDQWFVEGVARGLQLTETRPYNEWHFRNQIAGYTKRYEGYNTQLNFATVKGAGHMVPMDRPGPALQLLSNFFNDRNFDEDIVYVTADKPLKNEYQVLERLANITYTRRINANNGTKSVGVGVGNQHSPNRAIKNPRVKRSILHNLRKQHQNADEQQPHSRASTADLTAPQCNPTTDKINGLPNITFNYPSNQYSGYLQGELGVFLHYWFIEYDGDDVSNSTPIILWLNGGPGCSSLGGLLNELGPFRPSRDGSSIYENPFSFTKVGHVLFLESPWGVGFSFANSSLDNSTYYNDDRTAKNNVLAIVNFFKCYSQFTNRPFYITGESYGGVYIPTLTDALIKAIQNGTAPGVNFAGIAIGNGELSELLQIQSSVDLLYFRGTYDLPIYQQLAQCCPNISTLVGNGTIGNNGSYLTPCDFTQYITLDSYGNAWPKHDNNGCGDLVAQYGFYNVWMTLNDVYNTYQDCYNPPYADTGLANSANKKGPAHLRAKRAATNDFVNDVLLNNKQFVDQNKLLNRDSTDAFRGVYCYQDDATVKYVNDPAVRAALHIPDALPQWSDCNDDINGNYHQQHNDTTPVFDSILHSGHKLQILIYNGDVDMACQFKGDEWFIERLAYSHSAQSTERNPWFYTFQDNTGWQYNSRVAGFQKSFTFENVTLHQLTVKGAGHFVPLDRPGFTLQMINNFIVGGGQNFSDPLPWNLIAPKPLNSNLIPSPQPYTSQVVRETTMVRDLPGLTYDIPFGHHSGYLYTGQPGNLVHYWFVESHRNHNDPIIVWLPNEAECSSLIHLLGENGPFLSNPDGRTLFENVFSWNKEASLLYLDLPGRIGFSYNDAENDTLHWNDTVPLLAYALNEWASIFANFAGHNHTRIYLGGEGFAGILAPHIINEVQTNSANYPNIANIIHGLIIGNGYLSGALDLQYIGDYLYFHGALPQDRWDTMRSCCGNNGTIGCDLSQYVGNFTANANLTACQNITHELLRSRTHGFDRLNLQQDCYGHDREVGGFSSIQEGYVPRPNLWNYDSTDSNGGSECYTRFAAQNYLNQSHVRLALNIPKYVQPFEICHRRFNQGHWHVDNVDLNLTYVYQNIIQNGDLSVLFYGGDLSIDSPIQVSQDFAADVANILGYQANATLAEWIYARPGHHNRHAAGGFFKSYIGTSNNVITVASVVGAGTLAGVDRPGPTLQLIANFIHQRHHNLSHPLSISLERQPLKRAYQPPSTTWQTVANSTGSVTVPPPSSNVTTTGVPTTTKSGAVPVVLTSTPLLFMLFLVALWKL